METQGGHNRDSHRALINSHYCARNREDYPHKSHRYERKFSQTSFKRPGLDWKPAVRRYSVETGQFLYQHDYTTLQTIDLTPEHNKSSLNKNISRQQYLREHLWHDINGSKHCCGSTDCNAEPDDLNVDSGRSIHNIRRDLSVKELRQDGEFNRKTHCINQEVLLNPDDAKKKNSLSSDTQSTSESNVTDPPPTRLCCDQEAQRHVQSRTSNTETTVGCTVTDKSRAAVKEQNKLTSPVTQTTIVSPAASLVASANSWSVPTCCANVSAETRTPASELDLTSEHQQQQQQQQQQHLVNAAKLANDNHSFLGHATPCATAADSASREKVACAQPTVSNAEKLRMQDKQQEHVILSITLKHLVTPEQEQQHHHRQHKNSIGSNTTRSVEQSSSCGDFRSRSCSFGPARSRVATGDVSSIENNLSCKSMVLCDAPSENSTLVNTERWRIAPESHTSVYFVSSNLHQVFDRQQKQRLNILAERSIQYLAKGDKDNSNGTLDEITSQIKLQAYKQQQAYLRQLQSRLTSDKSSQPTRSTIANIPSMRQLVRSKLEDESLRAANISTPTRLERLDSLELAATREDHPDRPKSTLAEDVDRPHSRRSCSAFGKSTNVNCDTLYSALASDKWDPNTEAFMIESWLDDHPNFARDYFIRKAPRQMIDDWLVANAKVSNTNLSSQLDLRSLHSMSQPLSQLSLSSQLGGGLSGAPSWRGSENIDHDYVEHNLEHEGKQHATHNSNISNQTGFSCIRPNRSNSQSGAALANNRALAGSLTPIRKISATDFETRSGSGFLRPMLSKTPDGRLTFLTQTSNYAESASASPVSSGATKMGCVPEAIVTRAGRTEVTSRGTPTCGDQSKSIEATRPVGSQSSRLHETTVASTCTPTAELIDPPTSDAVCEANQRHQASEDDVPGHDEGEVRMIFELVKNIYDDLDIRTLFYKILKNIAVLINADRSSLFLVCGGPNDPNRRLVSQLFNIEQDSLELCNDMEKEQEDESITIPWGVGLVGYVAKSGEAVNIVNCYEDPRFTDAIDQRTGYVTRHMLCAPILDKRNEIVGVAQVINKRDGNPFSKSDESKFKRYLQFCGIGLRNAQSYEQCQLENRRNQVLLDLARMVFEEQSTIEQVVHRIMLHTQSLLDCERCQVLLIDNCEDELDSLLQMRQTTTTTTTTTHCSSSSGHKSQPNCVSQIEWRPHCSSEQHESSEFDDNAADTAREANAEQANSIEDLICKQQQQQQQQKQQKQPRLFSLVFDLECDGNDDPIVYETRSGHNSPLSGFCGTGKGTGLGEPNHKDRPFPINIGITGYVATTGETLNIENAHEHERFDSSVDENSDFRHKSILCMPIRNGQRQIIGVIQLINKKNGQPFNKNDENLFEAFAIFCGLGIHNTLMYERVLKVMAKQRVTFEVLSYHATAPLEEAKKLSQEQVPSCFALNLASLKFNDFSLDEQYMLKSCLRFFVDLDLVRRFQIEQLVLCNWILSVQKNYRKVTYHPVVGGNGLKASPVRYHNWRHAFNVSQMMFAILVNTQICHSLGELETLALLIACLCHDLDHRGTNNSFQIKSASPLAELYSTSTMEHHHFDQCVMILNSQGNQILSNLSPEEYSRVIMLLEEAILATDLANYFQKRDHFFQLVNSGQFNWRGDTSHRSILRCMLMTACDVAAITKPWPVQKVVADLVMSEFFQQGDIEKKELKIEPIDMMNREKMSELPSMQISFIDTICAPIYTAFAKLFPRELSTLLDGCLTNRRLWHEVAESNIRPEIPMISYLNCDTGDELLLETIDDKQELVAAKMSFSKSDTNICRKLSLCASDNARIRKKKISLSGSSDPIIKYDLHNRISQETVVPSGRDDDIYDPCGSQPLDSQRTTSPIN